MGRSIRVSSRRHRAKSRAVAARLRLIDEPWRERQSAVVHDRTERVAATDDCHAILAVFDSEDNASAGFNRLRGDGFTADQISIVARDDATTREMADTEPMRAASRYSPHTLVGTISHQRVLVT
jgi:hypothetical protein